MSEVDPSAEPARGPLGGSGASDAYAEPSVTVEEWRRSEALKAAATVCAGDTALSEQTIVMVAKVFEAYLKGDETV